MYNRLHLLRDILHQIAYGNFSYYNHYLALPIYPNGRINKGRRTYFTKKKIKVNFHILVYSQVLF